MFFYAYSIAGFKLFFSSIPFLALGLLASFALPDITIGFTYLIIFVSIVIGFALVVLEPDHVEDVPLSSVKIIVEKIFFFFAVVLASAYIIKSTDPDFLLLWTSSIPLYILSGRIFFRLNFDFA